MKIIKTVVLTIIFVFIHSLVFAAVAGPYRGKIIDSVNGDPLEGAGIVVAWTKVIYTAAGTITHTQEVKYINTDNKGQYEIPVTNIETSVLSEIGDVYVLIYQPGYQVITAHRSYGHSEPIFIENQDTIIKLERIPPNFNYRAQLKRIGEYYGEAVSDFSERYEWERTRGGLTSYEYKTRKKNALPYGDEIIKNLNDQNEVTRWKAARDLAFSKDKRAVSLLINALKDPNLWVRYEAIYSLGELNDVDAIPALLDILRNGGKWPYKIIQQEALVAVNKILGPTKVTVVVNPGREIDPGNLVIIEGVPSDEELLELKKVIIPVLISKIDDPYFKSLVIDIFEHINGTEYLNLIERAIHDPEPEIRLSALTAYLRVSIIQQQLLDKDMEHEGKENTENAFRYLMESLNDSDMSVRINSIEMLGRLGDTRAINPLAKISGIKGLKETAIKAIDEIRYRNSPGPKDSSNIKKGNADKIIISASAKLGDLSEPTGTSGNKTETGRDLGLYSAQSGRSSHYMVDSRPPDNPDYLGRYYRDMITRSIPSSVTLKLLDDLKSKNSVSRARAVEYLSRHGDRYTIKPLIKLLANDEYLVRETAFSVLDNLRKLRTVRLFLHDELMPIAESGNPEAQTLIGCILSERENRNIGYGVRPDDNEAVKWLQNAADSGYQYAAYMLGLVYELKPDRHEESFKWFLKAAENGYVMSQTKVAELYEHGKGVPRDYKKSMEWYLKAAMKGDALAQKALGDIYYYGFMGVGKDYSKSLEWYLKSVQNQPVPLRVSSAYFNIGEIYFNGEGVSKDQNEAIKWYRKASEKRDIRAIKKIDEILRRN